jgi:mRNA-degrading endonuclease RelE of RelBE toxin-antitoxin system
MKIVRTDQFKKDFQRLPEAIKRRTETALRLLLSNPHHPSLRIKKVKGNIL